MYDKLVEIHENINVGVSAFYTYAHMNRLKWDGSPSSLNNHISAILADDVKLMAMKRQVDREFLAFDSLSEEGIWESFHATVLSSMSSGNNLTFSAVADHLKFTVTAQQGTSPPDAALKADVTTKHKPKGRTDVWCDFHK